ncbi:hypothetical protein CLCR_05207 [Cladophialophora carrionii]|uniref:Secreted protein n=1 Tax=Cladophialophora carrionii TaxID=86049 RepID=A0A1C1CKN9_9EURO|nr:hypothetical protein CLCR_05207 [Cladophialophora carrionii]
MTRLRSLLLSFLVFVDLVLSLRNQIGVKGLLRFENCQADVRPGREEKQVSPAHLESDPRPRKSAAHVSPAKETLAACWKSESSMSSGALIIPTTGGVVGNAQKVVERPEAPSCMGV